MQPLCMLTSDYILQIWPQILTLKLKFVNYCEPIPEEAKKKEYPHETTWKCQRFENNIFVQTECVIRLPSRQFLWVPGM